MDVLLNNLELLHQDSGQLLDDMGAVARGLELDNDRLDNLIVDARDVNVCIAGKRAVVVGIAHFDGGSS